VAEALSGHAADGKPSTRPHVAYVPLANVGHQHADASIKGLAILLPYDMDDEHVLMLDSAVARVRTLHFGQRGDVSVRPHEPQRDSLQSLQTARYAGPSRMWTSVTPVVLGRHPKPKKGLTAEDVVAREIEHVGLPQPTSVTTQDTSFVRGSPPARAFHRGSVEAISGRVARHAWIEFDAPVEGPLVIGAGRHMGFGLMTPVAS
jgi:CRISPR-associated protein Csb2